MIRTVANVITVSGAIIGSTMVAANIGMAVLGYIFFLLSSASALYILWRTIDTPVAIVIQNIFFLGVNIFGIFRHLS